jgi:methylated-DNA-[protein]-cysteine S-methyltransferase
MSADTELTALEARLRAPTGDGWHEPGYDELVERALAAAEADGVADVTWIEHDAPTGRLLLAATERGVVAIGLLHHDQLLEVLSEKVSPRVVRRGARLDGVRRQLDEYYEGQRHEFDVPLDWALSSGFRRQILDELTHVPYGQVVSYQQLATRAGNPKASRAVGSAMATNPLPIVVPCHRVIRTDGSIGQYGGGVPMKVRLLELEGAELPGGRQLPLG